MSSEECRIKKFLSDLRHLDIHQSAFDYSAMHKSAPDSIALQARDDFFPRDESDVFLRVM